MYQTIKNEFESILGKWFVNVSTSVMLTIFESKTGSLPSNRIGQARFLSGKLSKMKHDEFYVFPKTKYGRHTTQAGIWMFLKKYHNREYLVTAFGKRKGQQWNRPAQYDGIHISYGTSQRVNFSPSCIDYLEKHMDKVNNAEVLICHNHPNNFVQQIFTQLTGLTALPSNQDRQTMFEFKYPAIVKSLSKGNFQNMRFFVVSDGDMREIQLPPVNTLIEAINKVLIN